MNTIGQESPYLFRLFNDNLWTDLSRVYLYTQLSLQKKTKDSNIWGNVTDEKDKTSCVQSLGQTFIQQVKVSIGNTEIYDSGNLYPYRVYITNELSFPDNVKHSFLSSTGYYKTTKHDDENDLGYIARSKHLRDSPKTEYFSRLDFDLGNQDCYLVNNIDILFTLYKAKDSFLIHYPNATDDYRLYLHTMKLFVKMIDVQPSLNLSIYSELEKRPARYAIRKTELRSYFLSPGRTEAEHNVFSNVIPRRIVVGLVANKAFNGDFKLSPFNFQHFNIKEISVHAGGAIYPPVPYNFDFQKNICLRSFVDMYEALNSGNTIENSCDISFDQFKNGWTFFVIPLTSTLDDTSGFELIRNGTTTIRMSFEKQIPENGVEMIVLGEYDQLLMIDFNRRVLTDNIIA